jgi:hypothetical protein
MDIGETDRRIPRTFEEIRQVMLDHFCGRSDEVEKKQEFMARGLTPTNNLSLYFSKLGDRPELAPGISNHHYYLDRPFGQIFQSFRDANPDLWLQARALNEERSALGTRYWNHLQANETEQAKALEPVFDQAGWEEDAVFSAIFEVLAPQLEEAGIDPLDVCV